MGYRRSAARRWHDKIEAARQARDVLSGDNAIILDTETTGLDYGDGFVEIAVIDLLGQTLFNGRFDPQQPIPADATAIHGMEDADVVGQGVFPEAYPALDALLRQRTWVIYNVEFDRNKLDEVCSRARPILPRIVPAQTVCAMRLYAPWWGAWNSKYGNYRWQKLTAACAYFGIVVAAPAHSALGDCQRTLALLQHLAGWLNRLEDRLAMIDVMQLGSAAEARKAAEANFTQVHPEPQEPARPTLARPGLVQTSQSGRLWLEVVSQYRGCTIQLCQTNLAGSGQISPDELGALLSEGQRALTDHALMEAYLNAHERWDTAYRQWKDERRDAVTATLAAWKEAHPDAPADDQDEDEEDRY